MRGKIGKSGEYLETNDLTARPPDDYRRLGCGGKMGNIGSATIRGRLISHDGRTQSLAAWGRELGLTRERVRQRIAQFSVVEALSPHRKTARGKAPRLLTYREISLTAREWALRLGITTNRMQGRWRASRAGRILEAECFSLGRRRPGRRGK